MRDGKAGKHGRLVPDGQGLRQGRKGLKIERWVYISIEYKDEKKKEPAHTITSRLLTHDYDANILFPF